MLLRFEWDPAKAASNLKKHGVSFQTAARVFLDPGAWIEHDRDVAGEQRWMAIGRVEGHAMLAVAHVSREEENLEVIRIISARRADSKERRLYEEANEEI